MEAIAIQARPSVGASVGIPLRRMDFEFPLASTRYWFGGDAYRTTMFAALSAVIPPGEAMFVAAVRHYRDRITDPLRKAEIVGFIGQEAMHRKEHDTFNEMMTRQGWPVMRAARRVGWFLDLMQKLTPRIFSLACTVCLEHFTAIIAEQLLRDEEQRKIADPPILNFWLWHALEESEHKSVAFDVYHEVGGGYLLRTLSMILVTINFITIISWLQLRFLAADGSLFKFRSNWRGFLYFWGRGGLFSRLGSRYRDFFRRDFHPTQHDTVALVAEWRERLFGEEGELRDRYRSAAALTG